ncbi:hypothetical protein VFPPC_14599 [Pochonia chlamydosporia 170]|uniref:Uncharacterized protein n=1 Tax=Pochonia chlamydosporia 170 TaxID=1380566 RepID=A0A179F842_METCM|nr:hypothetical protein VFPPC_14599 [Pochonia chlamydosporia 170]OAQ61602.1 hypothetical protein VFPPC_14599 [Pochonia chlamydosporia 170]
MQPLSLSVAVLSLASAASATNPKTTITATATRTTTVYAAPTPVTKCVTTVTVSTCMAGTTTVYKTIAAVPSEIDCKGCKLSVVTKTHGTLKPTVTVTKDYTLQHPPVCTTLPKPPTYTNRYYARKANRA